MINQDSRDLCAYPEDRRKFDSVRFRWTVRCGLKHFQADQLRALYGASTWNGSFKFVFVRNPWDRVAAVNTSAHAAYQEHYTDDLAALVAQRCARDIQQFGYTLDRN